MAIVKDLKYTLDSIFGKYRTQDEINMNVLLWFIPKYREKQEGTLETRHFQFSVQKHTAVVYISLKGNVVIMRILRAFALSTYKKPETTFYTRF